MISVASQFLSRHFRLLEALAIVLIAVAGISELSAVSRFERVRNSIQDDMRRRSGSSAIERKLDVLQEHLLEQLFQQQIELADGGIDRRRKSGAQRGIERKLEEWDARVRVLAFSEEMSVVSDFLWDYRRILHYRKLADIGPLENQDKIDENIVLLEKIERLGGKYLGLTNKEVWSDEFSRAYEKRDEIYGELYWAQQKTISDLAWLRARMRLVYMVLLGIGTAFLVIAKVGNWIRDNK